MSNIAVSDTNIFIDLYNIGSAITSGASVSGILYIFDQLVEQQIITPVIASNKLTELKSLNNRLPSREIEARLNLWLDKSK